MLVAVAGPLVVEYVQNGANLVFNTAVGVWLKAHEAMLVDKGHYSFVLLNKILKQDRELLLQHVVFCAGCKLVDCS